MNVNITARKFKAHDSLKEHVIDEVYSLEKFNDDIISADVKLSFRNNRESVKKAEIVLHVPGQILQAAEESDDFAKSVSVSARKLEAQLKKLKTKRIAQLR
jgi:putative sigma-54 modulation protein